MRVKTFEPALLRQLLELLNLHLANVVPGWAYSERFLAAHLERDRTQPITDPWVEERTMPCVVENHRVLAAAHLLRYGDGPEVSKSYRSTGEIDWFVFLPGHGDAAEEVLSAVRAHLTAWEVKREYGWYSSLPLVPMLGVPDTWPHVAGALLDAGYRPAPDHHREAIYGGFLGGVSAPAGPPVTDLEIRRTVCPDGTRFSAVLGGEELGFCEVTPDLTHGGVLPALRGWAKLQEIEVRERHRNQGVGSCLTRSAAAWLRLAGCDRIVLCVASPNEIAGAGRFYRRFGWEVLVREYDPATKPPGVDARRGEFA